MKPQAVFIAIVLAAATVYCADFPTVPPGTTPPPIVLTPHNLPIRPDEGSKVGPFANTSVALRECVRLVNESGALGHMVKLNESKVIYNGEPQWLGPGTAEHVKFSAADPRGKIATTTYILLPAHDPRIPTPLNTNRSHYVARTEMVDPPPLRIQITRSPSGTWSLDYLKGHELEVENRHRTSTFALRE
jgi:hypothetical protein